MKAQKSAPPVKPKSAAAPSAIPTSTPQLCLESDYLEFGKLLSSALKKILWLYFRTPVARHLGRNGATAVRERLFCYELYHQLRCACDTADFAYWIGGELDKDKHPIIHGGYIPDLVVHEPGEMDRNLCVLEVKPITGSRRGFKKDIKTLTDFTTKYAYYAGILLIFGDISRGEFVVRRKVSTPIHELRANRIYVLWIKNAQSDPVELQ